MATPPALKRTMRKLLLVWDPLWVAAMTPFMICVMFGTGACGADPDNCATLSEVVSRHRMLLNGFSMACFAVLLAQLYYICFLLIRFRRKVAEPIRGLIAFQFSQGIVVGGLLFAVSGTIGFVLNSMDLDKDAHTVYAGMAFIGTLVYLLGFMLLRYQINYKRTDLWRALAAWLVAAVTLALLGAGLPYWLEFVHISASTVCALMLVPPETHALFATSDV